MYKIEYQREKILINHLKLLEDEAIAIIHDTYRESVNPVVLYSIGKDSSVLLHLFRKAFFPAKIPIPFLHIDTGWKFREMISFRDNISKKYNIDLKVFKNLEGERRGVTPFNNEKYTDIMKTDALKAALTEGNYDFVYGGARRDEEASRSKEKILSHRDVNNRWDPKNQRIEPWNIFNTYKKKDESFRVFPISNWTEINVWEYIKEENIEIVNLYFANDRKVLIKDEQIILVDDERLPIAKNDIVETRKVRFRTLGCYPLTAGTLSNATTLDQIIDEIKTTKYSERNGRLIDHDQIGSMELKKREGYF